MYSASAASYSAQVLKTSHGPTWLGLGCRGSGGGGSGLSAHLPARRASKDPPTVTSVGERQRRARAGAAFLAGRRRDMARNDLKLGPIYRWGVSQCDLYVLYIESIIYS